MKAIIIFSAIIFSVMTVAAQKQAAKLNHIALYVEDLRNSAEFYQNIIGLDSIAEPFKDDLHAWFKVGSGLSLHLIQGQKETVNQYRSTHTCYSVGDINSFIQHLTKAGIIYEDSKGNKHAVTIRVDGIKQIYFKDPDGYWIEINNDK